MAYAEKHQGKWRGRYRDANGKLRVAGTSTSKRAAKAMAEDKEGEIRRGVWQDPDAGKMLFSEYFTKHWLPNKTVELNTLKTYESHYTATLRDAFGHMRVDKITGPVIQRWVAACVKEGAHPKTLRAKFVTLQTVLAGTRGVSAKRDGLINNNPCEGVTLPELDARVVDVYTPPEVDLVMTGLGAWWVPVTLLAAETGMRWGELMGLKVKDFSDDFCRVTVRRTLLEVTKADTGNGTPFMEKERPKGRRARAFAISPEVAATMQGMVRARQLFPEDRVFSMPAGQGLPLRTAEWPSGRPISRTFYRELWIKAHETSGVRRRRFHDMRGSHISWLLSGGADVKTVMERAGHAQLATTQLYVGVLDGSDERALDALAKMKARYQK